MAPAPPGGAGAFPSLCPSPEVSPRRTQDPELPECLPATRFPFAPRPAEDLPSATAANP